jgi:integrase
LDVSPKTAERYRELVRLQIRPHLGSLKVRVISPSRIEQLYGDLRAGMGPDGKDGSRPLSPKTIGHIHRILVQVFALAERDRLIQSNPARHAKRPKEASGEIEILRESEVRTVLEKLQGRRLWLICALGLSTGLRRGELLGLRWADVDFDTGRIHVTQSLEETKAGLRLKPPKTKQGRRQLSVPVSIIAELRSHRRKQTEQRLALGLGKDTEDGLVFRQPDGSPLCPNRLSCEWRRAVSILKLPKVTLHAWRHTHASQLIAAGMDVVTVSKRLGHANPTITLSVYSHLFHPTDSDAAAVFDRAFACTIGANKSEPSGTN